MWPVSDQPFKVGDLVMVKSGSPLMTVEALLENDVVTVVYYHDGQRRNEYHPSAVLERYRADYPGSRGGSYGSSDDWDQ